MSSNYRNELQLVDSEISELNKQIKPLLQKRNSIIQSEMRVCKHELIYSMSGNQSPYGDDKLVCRNCGIGLERGIGTMVSNSSIDFSQSEIVIPKNASDVITNIMLTNEQKEALNYPKRFNYDYLVNVLSGTPFNADDVMEKDNENYSWSIAGQFNSKEDWIRENRFN